MKVTNNRTFLIGLSAVLILTVGCSDNGPTTVGDQPNADQKFQSLLSQQSGDKIIPPTVHNTPITYEGKLFDGDAVLGSVTLGSIGSPADWDYWSFCGLAGDQVDIETHRTTDQMDPAQTLFRGTTDDSQGLDALGSTNSDMQFLAFADENNGIPHGVGGPFEDPRIVATLPTDGFYTITVFDFFGQGLGPTVPYELHISGISSCGVEFAEFVIEEAELELDDDDEEENEAADHVEDEFEVEGSFVLGEGNNGIDVLNEDVTVVFGTFSHTVSAGLFVRDDDDEGSEFDGTLPDGTRLKVEIDDDGEFEVEGRDLDLSGSDPNGSVFFSLQIGNDIGETTIAFDDGEFELEDDDDDDDDDEDDDEDDDDHDD